MSARRRTSRRTRRSIVDSTLYRSFDALTGDTTVDPESRVARRRLHLEDDLVNEALALVDIRVLGQRMQRAGEQRSGQESLQRGHDIHSVRAAFTWNHHSPHGSESPTAIKRGPPCRGPGMPRPIVEFDPE